MKKNFLFVLIVLLFSGFMMTACNSKPTIIGEFRDSEYSISIDEVVNFYDELDVKGVEKDKVVLSSSKTNVLSPISDFEFKGISSGKSIIFVSFENKVITQVEVNVKYRLSAPSNVKVDDNGRVSWDKSFVITDENKIEADSYKIVYKLDKTEDETTVDTNENYFLLPAGSIGRYELKIVASSDVENIDSSIENTYFVNYGIMEQARNLEFNPATDLSQKVVILWEPVENAKYDITINGIKVAKDLTESKFVYDFAKYNQYSDDIELGIIIKDNLKVKADSETYLPLKILSTPKLIYNFNNEAYITSELDDNALAYQLKTTNIRNGETKTRTYYTLDEFKETLNGFASGVYELTLGLLGGFKDEIYYINSLSTEPVLVAKLDIPNVKVSFVNKTLRLVFEQDDYINRYMISWGENKQIYDTTNGLVASFDLKDLEVGNYVLTIKALPTIDEDSETRVKEFVDTEKTNLVLDSDEFYFDFLVLEQMQEITHIYSDGISRFVVNGVENANFYELFINNNKINANYVVDNGVVIFTIDNLNSIIPVNSKYVVRIDAGYKVDNVEHSIRSNSSKTLEVLPLVGVPSNQINGSFQWNKLTQDCLYYYEIYKTKDNSYDISNLVPIFENEIADNKILEVLEEGYYTIKIISISTDTNNFLNSNFYNEQNSRQVNFIVTKDILTPNVSFKVEDGKYILTISVVDKGGEYKIFVDGEKDGNVLLSEAKTEIEYVLKDTLEDEGVHQIEVVAGSGKLYDGNLYLDSQGFNLNVTRLERASYEVEGVYSTFGELNGFNLKVAREEGATHIIFKCDGQVIESDDFELKMLDGTIYGSEFSIEMVAIAGDGYGNNYYIDSHKKVVEFERIAAPTLLRYENGIISWNYDDERVEKFYISLILKNSKGSDYPTCFFIDASSNEFDIQNKINSLREEDETFDTAYRQAEKIEIEVVAFKNDLQDGKYLLASAKGSTINGENAIVREQLEKPQLTFDPISKVVSWQQEGENSKYDVYLDGVIYIEDLQQNSFSITDRLDEFVRTREITVQAKNSTYLESDISSPIKIKQIASPLNISIDKVGEDFIASFDILSDTANISAVSVNDSQDSTLINYQIGGNTANFKLKDFDSNLKIVLIAKNESPVNYYVDSNEINLSMIDLWTCPFEVNLENDKIAWTKMGADFNGNNIDPISYQLTISDSNGSYNLQLKDKTSILLDEIEEKIEVKLNGVVTVKVFAYIDSHFILNLENSDTVGYYGKSIEKSVNTQKLEKVGEVRIEIIEDALSSFPLTSIEKTSKSSLQVKFDDLWADFDNIYLNVEVAGEKLAKIPADGIDLMLYRLERNAGEYTLYISNAVIAQLNAGEVDISIYISRDTSITSDKLDFVVKKFDTVKNTVVYDEGVLQINDNQDGASYKVEIAIEDILVTKVLSDEKSLNLICEELFLNRFGDYTIRLIAVDQNNLIIPSSQIASIKGYKLQGIENITIDEKGNINLNLYPDDFRNIQFVARYNDQEKLIEMEKDENSDTFFVAMVDALRLFDENFETIGLTSFDFLVRKVGSINSDYVNTKFEFRREEVLPEIKRNGDLDKDYLLFDLDEKTTSIRVAYNITDMLNEETVIRRQVDYFLVESVLGYWKEDENGNGEFVKERSGEDVENNFTYTPKIGISVNEILKDMFGKYNLEVSRIGKDETISYQYKPTMFNLYKLNIVDDDSTRAKIDNNIIRFNWEPANENVSMQNLRPTSYMIYFKDKDGNVVDHVVTYQSSYDIRNASNLLTKTNYSVYIVALHNNPLIIASDEITNDRLNFLIFPSPTSLEVKNGKIIFDEGEFKNSEFISDIKKYFQSRDDEQYYNMVGAKNYSVPYYFSPSTLADFNVTLKFNRVINGNSTDEVYEKTIAAYHLFPDVIIDNVIRDGYSTQEGKASYYDLLKTYRTTILGNPSANSSSTSKMIEALSISARGIGDEFYTFDDLLNTIPAGEYQVCIAQTTIDSYIESSNSSYVTMYVSPAPNIILDTITQDHNGSQKTYYIASVNTVNTKVPVEEGVYQDKTALRYKLQLREKNIDNSNRNTLDFIIYFDETTKAWIIDYGNFTDLKYILNDEEYRIISSDNENEFRINMSELKNAVNLATGEEIVKINASYEADIFVYYQDSVKLINDEKVGGKLINGKSSKFNVRYLDLKPEDFIFRNGVLSVKSGGANYQLLMKYMHSVDTQEQVTTLEFGQNTIINIDLTRAGTYQYVKLSINGSVSRKDLNIESAVYIIHNIHKLTAPSLKTANGCISIEYNEVDQITMGELSFYMGNNESLKSDYDGEDKGYYFNSSYINEVPLYTVGAINKDSKNVRFPSELIANEFYAYLNGNNGTFICQEDTSKQADYELTFSGDEEIPILSSSQSSLKAKMLGNVKSFNIDKGDIRVVSDEVEYDILDSDRERKKGYVLYEILVEYYYLDADDVYQRADQDTIYSERLDSAEQYISGLAINAKHDYYKLSIGLVGAKKVNSDAFGEGVVRTVEGTYFNIYNHLVYNDGNASDPTYVLRGYVNNTNTGYINRSINPRLAPDTNGVKNSKVNFIIDRSIYYVEPGGQDIASDTAQRIKIYADYEQENNKVTTLVTGQYTFSTKSSENEENNIYVSFTLDEGQLNSTLKSFVLRIYAYGKDKQGKNAIISSPLVINDVYKLTTIKDDYYDVILTDGKTGIDLSKYFENVSIQDNKLCYAITATAIMPDDNNVVETFTFNSSSKIFIIPNGAIRVDIRVVDNQSENEVNAKKLLPSDTKRMDTQSTTIDELEIEWNNILKRFEWSWPEGNTNKYDYVVTVNVNGFDEVAVVRDNFYCPRASSGMISANGFSIKARIVDSENDKLSIYSEDKVFESDMIIYELFSDGEGTQKQPYKINTLADFKNMSLRNTGDYYFELGENLTIKVSDLIAEDGTSHIFEEFNAKLNGRNRALTVISDYAFDMETFTFDIFSQVKLTSNYYSSLFNTITSTGSISNISLRYQIKDLNVNNKEILFAPICLNNYGIVSNLTLSEFTLSIKGQSGTSTERFATGITVGGFVSINYNVISDCTNNATFAFEAPQMVELSFAYAGITTYNANQNGSIGKISSCFNKKNKSVALSVTNSKLYMAGITLTNMGNISLSGNDSNFEVSDSSNGISANAYFAGIAISNKNGTLEYLYNNGRMETKSSMIRLFSSGIVYQIEGGNIQTLVETISRQPIVKNISTMPKDLGGHYAGNNSGTHTSIVVSELIEIDIDCKDNKILRIKLTEGNFVASIQIKK